MEEMLLAIERVWGYRCGSLLHLPLKQSLHRILNNKPIKFKDH